MPPFVPVLVTLVAVLATTGAPRDGFPDRDEPCGLCKDSKLVGCPTCAGRGRSAVECVSCRGVGRSPCASCKISQELAAVLRALQVKVKRGHLPCPNQHCDKKGMVTWKSAFSDSNRSQERDPCKVCDGRGTHRCGVCSEGMAACSGCAGKGRLDGTCRDCAGSGKLPCPGCTVKVTSRSCPFCRNEKKRACALCKDSGDGLEVTVKCAQCGGVGTKPCTECAAIGRTTCFGCGGTGNMRKEIVGTGEKAGKAKHDACKGAGWDACSSCKAGRADCRKCKNGDVTVRCPGCRDAKVVVCHGCIPGTWNAFEICGRVLHGAERYEEAGAFYTAALQRVTGVLVNEDPEFPERKRAMDLWLKQERERLEAAAVAADQRKPPPGKG